MDTREFRRHAHALVDWMADYMEGVERHPVRSPVKPGEIAARPGNGASPGDRPRICAGGRLTAETTAHGAGGWDDSRSPCYHDPGPGVPRQPRPG
jgi:hypothetical protein